MKMIPGGNLSQFVVHVLPRVISVAGCEGLSNSTEATLAELGLRLPGNATFGTFNCPTQGDITLFVTCTLGVGALTGITVDGSPCPVIPNATSRVGAVDEQDILLVPCRLAGGQGLFRSVTLTTQEEETRTTLVSDAASLVSFRLPVILNVGLQPPIRMS